MSAIDVCMEDKETARLGTAVSSFSRRPPSPPHIYIGNWNESVVVVAEATVAPFVRESDISEEEVKNIFAFTRYTHNNANWKWEMRHLAQSILPSIYLGPMTVAKNRPFLRKEGITMLLAVRSSQIANASMLNLQKVALEEGLVYDSIDGGSSQNLLPSFSKAILAINDHLLWYYRQHADESDRRTQTDHINFESKSLSRTCKTGKVLIFCESGNHRSAAIVTAYLMVMCGLSMEKAFQFLQVQRFCVAMDDEIKHVLMSFEGIFKAGIDVGRPMMVTSAKALAPSVCSTRKRPHFTTLDDSDTDMATYDDDERFDGRSSFTPYA